MNANTIPTREEVAAARYNLSNNGCNRHSITFTTTYEERNPDASHEEFVAAVKADSAEYIKRNRAVVQAYESASPTQRAAACGWRLKEVAPGVIRCRRDGIELRLSWKSFLAAESAGDLV